jgi:F1F0 ATPase subunit 2
MNEIVYSTLAFAAGIALGILFFGGLWFTVKNAVKSKLPGLWVSLSSFIRIGITLLGFYYISLGSWQRLLICLAGFVIARFGVIRFTKPDKENQVALQKEVSNEA